jgi:serralysin
MPTTSLSAVEAGQQITRDNLHWGTTLGEAAGPISFGFRTSAPSYSVSGENVQGTFSSLSAAEQTAASDALAAWASIANITFSDLGASNSATIEFANYQSTTDNSEAFTFYPGSTSASSSAGDVFVNTYYASTISDAHGTYEYMTFLHEIGHALGLEHPADYNAGPSGIPTYQDSATYIQDTRQYSLMSYFDESYTGGHYSVYDQTPMLDDIAAIQHLYGANLTTRTENDTYGFHSNLSGTAFDIASASQHAVFTVYDCGGTDTFDFSGYSQAQTIDLNAEHFSSVGGDTYNICIAQNVTIENAIGGSGNDTIIGNAEANVLNGGDGNDTITGGGGDSIIGGSGVDTAVYSGNKANYLVSFDAATQTFTVTDQRIGSPDGTDRLSQVEYLKFADQSSSLTADTVSGTGEGDPVSIFDAQGHRLEIVYSYSDGGKYVYEYDALSQFTWSTVETSFDAGGERPKIIYNNDDGTKSVYGFDVDNVFVWSGLQTNFDTSGQRDKIIYTNDDHTSVVYQYDVLGAYSWSSNARYFDDAGHKTKDVYDNDTGSHTVYEYNAAGNITSTHQFDSGWHLIA